MTYDLAVWEGDRPHESNAAATFTALYDRYIGRDRPDTAHAGDQDIVESLLERWYEMGDPRDVDDTSPWSDAPLINNAQGPIIYFAMRYSMAEEVSAVCAQIAAECGLVCFDVRWDQLHPDRRRVVTGDARTCLLGHVSGSAATGSRSIADDRHAPCASALSVASARAEKARTRSGHAGWVAPVR